MPLDVTQIREDFPILKRKIHGHNLVYLDNAASSQKPKHVLYAMNAFYQASYANIHRGVYTIAEEATEIYESARESVKNYIHAQSTQEIIFTRGTTESINLVARAWGDKNIFAGDVILLTEMEHHSNIVPWQLLAERKRARLKYIPFDAQGKLTLDNLDSLLQDAKIVSFTLASNTLGTKNPAKAIIQKAHAKGIPVLLDGAQAAPHLLIDVQDLDCDFLAFSSHKMLGPTGIGVLYGKKEHLEKMDPFLGGGEMIKTVAWDHSTWNDLPWKFEAGTQSIAEAVGFKAAIDYLHHLGLKNIEGHEESLVRYAMERLGEVDGLQMLGPSPAERVGLVSFYFGDSHGNLPSEQREREGEAPMALPLEGATRAPIINIHPHDVAAMLDRNGICVRAGHHCTMPLHKKLGLDATVRASFYLYNTKEEVDLLIDGLKETVKVFKK